MTILAISCSLTTSGRPHGPARAASLRLTYNRAILGYLNTPAAHLSLLGATAPKPGCKPPSCEGCAKRQQPEPTAGPTPAQMATPGRPVRCPLPSARVVVSPVVP